MSPLDGLPAPKRNRPDRHHLMTLSRREYKLYIPGPVRISEKTLRALQTQMMPHRGPEFVALYRSLQPGLQALFGTRDPVFLATSSAWGVMEASVRNLTRRKVLNCMNGAFSDRWNEVAARLGRPAGALRFDWGAPVDPEAVRRELASGDYDTITLIHNETSTGTMTDLAAVMAVVREFPEVISIVDTVSSFSVLALEKDALGIDVVLTGSQKGLALPPGLVPFSVSSRALERVGSVPDRGFYFDFLEFLTQHEKGMTPTTPSLALFHALRSKLDDIAEEGLEARFARHARLNRLVRDWGRARGFRLLPDERYGSLALNCFVTPPGLDVAALVLGLKERHGFLIDGGYGKLQGRTIRISNMGDETDATMAGLLEAIDDVLRQLEPAGSGARHGNGGGPRKPTATG